MTTVLLSLVTIVAVLRGFCRCCRAGATMQDLLLQLGMQKAPERISVLEESHPGVHGPGDSRRDAPRAVGVEKMLLEVAARWLLSAGWCCSTCYRSWLTILGSLRRTLRDDSIEPPLAPIPARTPMAQLCAGGC